MKEKLAKLTDFINSEKFYELSDNNRLLLKNQKIVMELYLNVLNMRVFEDVDKIVVPDYSMMQVMGSVFGNTFKLPDNLKTLNQVEGPKAAEAINVKVTDNANKV